MDTLNRTRTELHTHLMGMLSAQEFLNLLATYTDKIIWPLTDLNTNNKEEIDIDDLRYKTKEFNDSISISSFDRKPYKQGLSEIYRNRNTLLAYIVKKYSLEKNIKEDDARIIIYNDYFNRALEELISQGIKYVEISFANDKLFSNFKINDKNSNNIKVMFLKCTQRTFKIPLNIKKTMDKIFDNGIAVGFDIMGMETPISDDEMQVNGAKSIYTKLSLLLETLTQLESSVLRIHSGEAPGCEENTEKIFRIIDRIKKDKGYHNFPPPELRIGHGIYYNKTKYYYDFMKENNVIVEINESSNFALSNVNDYKKIPIKDYLDHDIPIVLSTDGHGAYSTTIKKEDIKAYYNLNNNQTVNKYEKVIEIDENILKGKCK